MGITPGSITTYGIHQIHYDLDKFNSYLPLSLFMNENLHIILREANSLPLRKINPPNLKTKPPLVLDIDLFEKKYGQEESLSHPAWLEATCNFVRFTAETGKDGVNGTWHDRWDQRRFFRKSY
jgi:hypothetical protein